MLSQECKVEYFIYGYSLDTIVLILIFQVKKVSSRQTNRKFIGRIVHQQYIDLQAIFAIIGSSLVESFTNRIRDPRVCTIGEQLS